MRTCLRRLLTSTTAALVLALAGTAAAGPVDVPGFAKAMVCSACHGLGGNSVADSMPSLAGMSPAYFKKAIEDYASRRRPSAEMEPFARMVLELGVAEIAGYFAQQAFRSTPIAVDRAAVERGRTASAECVLCHGRDGRGDPDKVIPSLAGQPPGYLRAQMELFKRDERSPGDAQLRPMKTVMAAIPDNVLADLAAYYASLRPGP